MGRTDCDAAVVLIVLPPVLQRHDRRQRIGGLLRADVDLPRYGHLRTGRPLSPAGGQDVYRAVARLACLRPGPAVRRLWAGKRAPAGKFCRGRFSASTNSIASRKTCGGPAASQPLSAAGRSCAGVRPIRPHIQLRYGVYRTRRRDAADGVAINPVHANAHRMGRRRQRRSRHRRRPSLASFHGRSVWKDPPDVHSLLPARKRRCGRKSDMAAEGPNRRPRRRPVRRVSNRLDARPSENPVRNPNLVRLLLDSANAQLLRIPRIRGHLLCRHPIGLLHPRSAFGAQADQSRRRHCGRVGRCAAALRSLQLPDEPLRVQRRGGSNSKDSSTGIDRHPRDDYRGARQRPRRHSRILLQRGGTRDGLLPELELDPLWVPSISGWRFRRHARPNRHGRPAYAAKPIPVSLQEKRLDRMVWGHVSNDNIPRARGALGVRSVHRRWQVALRQRAVRPWRHHGALLPARLPIR